MAEYNYKEAVEVGSQTPEKGNTKIDALRNALIAGEASGPPRPVDVDLFLQRMRLRHQG